MTADFSGSNACKTSVAVSHYAIIEGKKLHQYLVVQSLVLANIVFMLVDACYVSLRVWKGGWNLSAIGHIISDVLCCVLVLGYIALMFQTKPMSADEAEKILEGLDGIPWDNSSITILHKMKTFDDHVASLMQLIEDESRHNVLCFLILVVNVMRVSRPIPPTPPCSFLLILGHTRGE
jgi:Ca2+/Na+ antiporter